MIYIKSLRLPSELREIKFIEDLKQTFYHTVYPFKIFPEKRLDRVAFDGITLLYGGNGSGKSTLLNVLARKMQATRYADFNDSPFFDTFVDMCTLEYEKIPKRSFVLTSDDVFDYTLNARSVNEDLADRRNALLREYIAVHHGNLSSPETARLHGLDDSERRKEIREILSPKHTQSAFIRKRVERSIDLHSNGETAMQYFVERIDEDAVYFLDEPENSLSIKLQIELAEYIEATARATRSQFIIATHSPIFLSMKNSLIYDLDAFPASTASWTELPNVRRYFDFFMEHRDEFL